MGAKLGDDQDYEGGSERVKEKPEEVPKGGRTAGQVIILVIAALVVLAAVLWMVVPLGGS